MPAVTRTRACARCRQEVPVTPSGHLRAHECPHGAPCVLTYAARRLGDKPRDCRACLDRQLPLFELALRKA
jgi:hypothetical protein